VGVLAAIGACGAELHGAVEVRRRGVPYWEPVAVGGVFRGGDWLRTGKASSARIRFRRGGRLELDEGTTLLIEAAGANGPAPDALHVSVESGSAPGSLGPGASTLAI